MNPPTWLRPEVVVACHAHVLAAHGGAPGVRDAGILASALSRPERLLSHAPADLCRLAAAYAYGLAKYCPFAGGNSGTAFLAAAVFLERNGLRMRIRPDHAAVFVKAVTAGSLSEEAFADWLRERTVAAPRRAKRRKAKAGGPAKAGRSRPKRRARPRRGAA
jgi:death-on-curing protein